MTASAAMESLSHTTILGVLPISPVANVRLSGCRAVHQDPTV